MIHLQVDTGLLSREDLLIYPWMECLHRQYVYTQGIRDGDTSGGKLSFGYTITVILMLRLQDWVRVRIIIIEVL